MSISNPCLERIMIVDDEPIIGEACLKDLTAEGFTVDITANGEKAQNMLDKEDYALIIINIQTSVMKGKTLDQFIKDNHPELLERVIYINGEVEEDIYRGIISGHCGWIHYVKNQLRKGNSFTVELPIVAGESIDS